ncbi:MAG: site-specific integrase [Desulfobacterium sp.]
MDQLREVLRYHHYAYRTEQTYCQWTLRYIRFFGSRLHPRDLNAHHVERFLSDLVVKQKVSTGRIPIFPVMLRMKEYENLPFVSRRSSVRPYNRNAA